MSSSFALKALCRVGIALKLSQECQPLNSWESYHLERIDGKSPLPIAFGLS